MSAIHAPRRRTVICLRYTAPWLRKGMFEASGDATDGSRATQQVRIPVRTRSHHLYAPGCTFPAHLMEKGLSCLRRGNTHEIAPSIRTGFALFRTGHAHCGMQVRRTTKDTIARRVAQPLRTHVRTALTLNERPLRKQFACYSHRIVQSLNTRFTRGRRPLRKTFTPGDKKRTENTVLQDRLPPVSGALSLVGGL